MVPKSNKVFIKAVKIPFSKRFRAEIPAKTYITDHTMASAVALIYGKKVERRDPGILWWQLKISGVSCGS